MTSKSTFIINMLSCKNINFHQFCHTAPHWQMSPNIINIRNTKGINNHTMIVQLKKIPNNCVKSIFHHTIVT